MTDAYAYLADRSPAAAHRLLGEIEAVVQLLASFPEIGRPRNELRADVRSFRVRDFRHIIFYRRADASSPYCESCTAPGKLNPK